MNAFVQHNGGLICGTLLAWLGSANRIITTLLHQCTATLQATVQVHIIQYRAYLKATIQFFIVAFLFVPALNAQTDAFPGAEGFGRYATGGRGGRVIEVTNLNDNGTGSLRAAISATGARTIVFRVSGTIKLLSTLRIRNGNLTIAGQTAPGDGICLRDRSVKVEADNVIIRYLRFRLGDSTKVEDDSFSGTGSLSKIYKNVIIDHCSISWAIDENGSFYDNGLFTVQWCYITESLYRSYHSKGDHGYGGIWGGWKVSFHHNLFAHNTSRNPRFNGSRYTSRPDSELVDFRNNVIYNWGFNTVYGGEGGSFNIVANYYKYGPGTSSGVRYRIVSPDDTIGNWHIADNYVYGSDSITADNWNGGVQGGNAVYHKSKRRVTAFAHGEIQTQTPQDAFEAVLMHGGASLPKRDTVDARIASEVRNGTATYGGAWGAGKGIIDSPNNVGGYPLLQSLPASADSDRDGMPDDWENSNSLNPADSTDGQTITGNGYSNLELYINGLIPAIPTSVNGEGASLPSRIALLPNYPNPFNPTTTIQFVLAKRSRALLEVFDTRGARIATLVDDTMDPGFHKVKFDAKNLGSGIYFYRLSTGGIVETQKMLLLK